MRMINIEDEMIELRAAMLHLDTALKGYATAARFQTDAERLESMCRQELRKIIEIAEAAEQKLAEITPAATA
jgi:hypothetical protein